MGLEEYKETNIMSEDRFELVKKLYERAILNLKYLSKYADFKKQPGLLTNEEREINTTIITNRVNKLNETVDIVELLKSSLNMEDEVLKESSQYLYGLYEYQLLNLYKLMIKSDKNEINKILNVFEEMLKGWVEVVEAQKNG